MLGHPFEHPFPYDKIINLNVLGRFIFKVFNKKHTRYFSNKVAKVIHVCNACRDPSCFVLYY